MKKQETKTIWINKEDYSPLNETTLEHLWDLDYNAIGVRPRMKIEIYRREQCTSAGCNFKYKFSELEK